MVKTRSRNKRVTYAYESDPEHEDDCFEDEHGPAVPVTASSDPSSPVIPCTTRRRSKRRKRGEDETIVVASMDMLCDDVVSHVFSMVGSPRDVLSFALCSKRMHNLLTPHIVIRSAVFSGGNEAKSIRDILGAVECNSIFVPDTNRLLRLVNGRRCERLDQCWSYNLETQLSGQASIVSPGIGMFLCRACGTSLTTALQGPSWSWIRKEDTGVATTRLTGGYRRRAVNHNNVEAVTGNPCGPIVCMRDIRQIESTYREEEDRREAVKCLVERNDKIDKDEQQRGGALVEIFEKAEVDLEAYNRRRYKAARAKDRERNGKTKLKAIFAKLESLLDSSPWKEVALACHWYDNIDNYPHIDFRCSIVHQATEHLFSAPSSCTQKKLKAVVEEISIAFNLLHEKNIFSFSPLASSTDAFERGLYQYCRDNVTPAMLVEGIPWTVEQTWWAKVRKNDLCGAIIDLFRPKSMALQEAFATAVVSSERVSSLGLDVNKFCAVARKMWCDKFDDFTYSMRSTSEVIGNLRNVCRDEYAEREESLVDFLSSPVTRNWLDGGDDGGRDLGFRVEFTRQNAIDQVFTKRDCILLLQTRRFGPLLRLVKRYYRRPGHYDLLPGDDF